MKFKIQYFHDIMFITEESFRFCNKTFLFYPSFCGAGKGIGDKIIPEKMYGLKVSPACHIHDDMWDKASDTFFEFMLTNMIFIFNIWMIIIHSKGNKFIKMLRCLRAVTYFTGVFIFGRSVFKKLKKDQYNA